jgi:protein-disulfide isomerase
MKNIPGSVWLMGLVIAGVLGLIGLAMVSQQQTFADVKLPVEITEYFDYQCSHCAEFAPTMAEIKAKYGDKVNITYKHYAFLNDNSFVLAYAAEAAREQGKFLEFHDLIFTTFNGVLASTTDATALDPITLAQTLELDMDKFDADRNSDVIQDRVRNDKSEGAKLGVSSTPTVFVYGQKVSIGAELIQQLVDKASQNTQE